MLGKIPLFFSPPWCYDRKPDVIKNKEGIVFDGKGTKRKNTVPWGAGAGHCGIGQQLWRGIDAVLRRGNFGHFQLICFGIALSNRCGLPIVPTDLFPRELADITKVPYPRIKIGFDVTCLAITAGMTFFFLGRLEGLGIGTIAAAFTMGKGIGLVGDLLDKHFYFENYKTLRTAKNKQ